MVWVYRPACGCDYWRVDSRTNRRAACTRCHGLLRPSAAMFRRDGDLPNLFVQAGED